MTDQPCGCCLLYPLKWHLAELCSWPFLFPKGAGLEPNHGPGSLRPVGDRRTASASYGLGSLRSRKRGCWRKEWPTGQTATKASSETSTDGANAAAVVAWSSAVAAKHVQNPWLMFNQLSPWPRCHSSICSSEVSQTAWRQGWIRAPLALSSSTVLPSAIWEYQGVRITPLCGIHKWTRGMQIKLEAVSMFMSLSRVAAL